MREVDAATLGAESRAEFASGAAGGARASGSTVHPGAALDEGHAGASAAAASADSGKPADKKAKPPSKVALTSFVVYKVHGKAGDPSAKVEVLAGGSGDARFLEDGKLQLLAGSAPFHSRKLAARIPKPGHGLLALYGHRDALEEVQFWRNQARELKAEFAYVNYDVQVDRIHDGLVDRTRLLEGRDARFLNMRRTMNGLQTDILERFQGYVAEERGPKNSMTAVSHIALRPDLFDRLFEDDKDFQHLSVFVIPVADDPETPGRMRQLAYVRPGATVLNEVQGASHVDVLLPRWVTDANFAKKVRKGEA